MIKKVFYLLMSCLMMSCAHHATPMMKTISSLREKYDLTMRAERYYRAEEDLTENDSKYIRDR